MNSDKELSTEHKSSYIKVGFYSLVVNVILVITKLVISYLTGSLALRADAVHSSIDMVSSIALLVGLVISNRKSKNFPYGLYKVENITAVIISVSLFITAYEIVIQTITVEITTVSYDAWVLVITGAMVLAPFLFSRYEVRIGRKYNSPSLIADGNQFTTDVISASIVFFALLGQYFGLPLDRIAAIIVVVFIVRASWILLSSSMRVLLDASIDADTLSKIRTVIESEPAVVSIRNVTGRNSGRYVFVETSITLRVSDLAKAYQISQRIENKVKESLCYIDRILVHYEPETPMKLCYAIPVMTPNGEINQHFGEAPYFALVYIDTQKNRIIKQEIIENPHLDLEKGKGIKVAQFLLVHKVDVIVTQENLVGKGPGYVFTDAGIKTTQTEAQKLDAVVDQLLAANKALL